MYILHFEFDVKITNKIEEVLIKSIFGGWVGVRGCRLDLRVYGLN